MFVWGIVGPLGIRSLFGTKPYYPDVTCISETGEIVPSDYEVNTVISRFKDVIKGNKTKINNSK